MSSRLFRTVNGPRKGITSQRKDAISLLRDLELDGTIKLSCFDKEDVQPTKMDADAYIRAASACDIAIFALAEDPGTIHGTGKNITTFTMAEWNAVIRSPVTVYLLLSHRLDDSFIAAVTKRKAKNIWKMLRKSMPTKHIITFDKNVKGDLLKLVARTIAQYLAEMSSRFDKRR